MINPTVFFFFSLFLIYRASTVHTMRPRSELQPREMDAHTLALDYSQLFQWVLAFNLTFEILFFMRRCLSVALLWKIYGNNMSKG